MGILVASESNDLRDHVRQFLDRVRRARSLKVLDVGGGKNSWLGSLVTHVMDIDENESVVTYRGDVCSVASWDSIPDKHFDFVNCSHTLEDIRDPGTVIAQMSRVGRAGFVAVPNRHVECVASESRFYLGFGHHRWIFHIRLEDQLEAIAKFPAISHRQFGFPRRLAPKRILSSRFEKFVSPGPSREWLNPALAHEKELGLVWVQDLPFAYAFDDFAGRSVAELRSQSEEFLGAPFVGAEWTSDTAIELESILAKQ